LILIDRLHNINFAYLHKLIHNYLIKPIRKSVLNLSPVPVIGLPKTETERNKRLHAKSVGEEAIKKGKVAILVVAGGQGSRLGFDGTKGKFNISTIKKKSFFKLNAEKILALEKRYNTKLTWLVMTSESNDAETRDYFEENEFFGLQRENVFIFKQGMLPTVDTSGNVLMKSPYEPLMNPDGHGGCINAMVDSGGLNILKRRGIEYIFYYQIDNALIVMADPIFIGYHILNRSDMSGKVLPKAYPEEKIGIFGYDNKKMRVIEYSDLSREDMYAKDSNGNLLYSAGNIAIHIISVDFIERIGSLLLPIHIARRKVTSIDGETEAIKFERFIFDAFAEANNPTLLEAKREDEFAPTKNMEGVDSINSARKMMTEFFATWLESAGIKVPRNGGYVFGNIEVSPLFALDREEFLERFSDNLKLDGGFSLYIGENSINLTPILYTNK
jgi:UDP-N-acetylglucosamine/UDP-N-acetylgalactosamine diphosphorylase